MAPGVRPRTTLPSSWLGTAASWLAQNGWRGGGCGCRAGPGLDGLHRHHQLDQRRGLPSPWDPPPPPPPPGQGHVIAPSGRGQGLSWLGPPWDRMILRPEGDWLVWGMAGGSVPSDTADFSSVCVPFQERLIRRRASRGDFRNWKDTNSWELLLWEFVVRHFI